MLDDLGGGNCAEVKRLFEALPASSTEQEAGCEQVTRAGRVDQLVDGLRANVSTLAATGCERSVLATGDNQDFDLVLDGRDGALEVGDARKCFDLRLVGEEDVDLSAV